MLRLIEIHIPYRKFIFSNLMSVYNRLGTLNIIFFFFFNILPVTIIEIC